MADDLKRVGLVFKADGSVDFNKSLKEVNASVQENRSAFKLAKSTWDDSTKSADKLKATQKYLADQTKDYSDKVKLLERELKELESSENRNEQAIQKKKDQLNTAKTSLNNYKKGLEEVNDKLKLGKAEFEDYAKKVQETGDKLTSAGKTMAKNVTAPITAIGVASANMAMKFEDAMAKVSTIADSTEMPIEDLEKAIVDLSDQTGISSTEIANNVYDAISAGQKTGDAVNFVSNSTKLAKAGFADAGNALDILTTIMNSYGMEASEVTKVSDILIQTQNLGKTTVAELSSSMGKIIPTAKANSVALDQIAAGYAIVTANGVATAEATTYMNSMLNELGKSGTKVSDTLKDRTGKSFSELMQGGASLSEVLKIVSDSATEQGLAFSDLWGSAEAGKAGLILLGESAETFNDTLENMRNSTGATETAFEKMNTNSYGIEKTINQLKNALIDLGSTILEVLAPTLGFVSEKIKQFSEWFRGLDESQKKTIVTIALVVAAIAPLLLIVGTACSGVSKAILLVTQISSIMMKIPGIMSTIGTGAKLLWTILAANPVAAIILAVTGLIAIFVTLYNKCEWFRDGVDGIWKGIKDGVGGFTKKLKELLNFKWELPKIKLPHFKIKGKFSLTPPSVPKLDVKWYAKGGILNSPTIFGANGTSLMGGGEAGAEAVLPIDNLRQYIREEMARNNATLAELIAEAISDLKITAVNNISIGDRSLYNIITEMVIKKMGLNTQNIKATKGW